MKRFETDVVLRDGSLVRVRPVRPEDRVFLVGFINSLSLKTHYLRFLHTLKPEQAVRELIPKENQFALLAMRDEMVIGHAIYTVTLQSKAEPAVVVADAYQGKGLGTILLGQLTQAAIGAGIAELEAHVAPENAPMLQVLRELGFPTVLKSEPGFIHVTFPASLLPEALARFEQREAVAAIAAMKEFFQPRGVAVVGASRKRGGIGGELFRNILEAGFQGPVYPVNANADVVQSVKAYRSVLDCPSPVDLAFIVTPASVVLPVIRECAQKGVRALVVISAGFAAASEAGVQLQQELVEVCRETGMRLIGPNCMGIINTDPKVNLNGQFSPFKPIPGKIGFLSQSGALGIAIIDYANRLGLGMSTFVSVGNKADISGNDLIQYWESDDNTNLILLYLESFGNPRKFARITQRVSRKKPIIAVKGGRSAAGFRATQSHTGALGGLLEYGARPTVYMPPSFSSVFKKQVSRKTEVIKVTPGLPIAAGLFTTGEMGRSIAEQALIIQTEQGLVIVTGCAHPGIVEIVEQAQTLLDGQVRLVLGGFHLGGKREAEIDAILTDFRRLEVEQVAPCHCTGDQAIAMFAAEYGEDFIQAGVGRRIIIR